jgi:CIC family chloride channel protein
VVVLVFEPHSMEARKLASKLNLTLKNRDQFLLSKLDLTELIEKNFSIVHAEETLQALIKTISSSKRNLFPVVDDSMKLVGVVHLDNIRSMIFTPARHEHITVKDVMTKPAAIIEVNEHLSSVLQKFDETHQWNLPVTDQGKYVGFVSKSSILTRYRTELMESA